jgi:chaperonin GroEL
MARRERGKIMQEDKTKITTFNDEAHRHYAEAVDIMETAVGSTYGPGGRPMLIKKKYVDPILSTDGVTVARNIAGFGSKLGDPRTTDAAKLIYQASEKTNKTAGDGTTATVVMLGELYKSGRKQIAAGVDAMLIKRQVDDARNKITEFVQSKSIECDKDKLVQVATISGKDEGLGHMIADLVWDVGSDGAITIEYQNAPHVEVEKVTGYLFGNGFKNLAQDVEFEAPIVFVTQKRMAAKGDIVPILEIAAQNQKQFVIVGDVSGAAYETLVWAISNQKADGLCIPPPAFGADGHDYFEDIATYTGSKLWLESDSFSDVTLEDFGSIKRSRISRDKAILFGDNKTGKAIVARISQIKEQIEKQEMTPSLKEVLETRLAKLAGKVSIVKVGAATEVEREELFFRVEDAVEASKSALASGVVAGGATTLLFASQLDLPAFVKEALQEPFKLLMKNAAERGDYRLEQVLRSGYGEGFDLKNMTDEPVDLIKEGVVDATKVVLQTVKNSFSVAGGLLSAGGSITEEEDEKPKA